MREVFTIIAYPVPEIGENFPEIFREIVKINTLDYKKYQKIQQTIIDTLDTCEWVEIKGKGENETDLLIHLHTLTDAKTQTNFENCVADVIFLWVKYLLHRCLQEQAECFMFQKYILTDCSFVT